MYEYIANDKKEKELAKTIRKRYKRWKIGRWFVLILLLAVIGSIVSNAVTGMDELKRGAEGILVYILGLVGFALIPFIAMLIVYAISISAGRDILRARSTKRVYLDPTQLRNTFTPNFTQIIDADFVEICVPYENIQAMSWNKGLCRLEITAVHTLTLQKDGTTKEQVVKDKPVILYDYFDSMDRMLSQIEVFTNIKIVGRV